MPRFAEFFSGIGLVREAIEPLGWTCVFANDIAPDKAKMYIDRFGDDHLMVDDINNLTLEDLPGDLDLLTASFPCIDLSLAGNRRGLAGEHSGTVWPFLDLAADIVTNRMPPKALLLENVTGFVTSHGGSDLERVCDRIGELGYLIDLVVVDAKWFTPQSRPRLFVVAIRADLVERPLSPTADRSRMRTAAIRSFQASHHEVPFSEIALPEPPQKTPYRLIHVLDDVPANHESWWPEAQVWALQDKMHDRHAFRIGELLLGKRDGVATMYRRVRSGRTVGELRGDSIAGCLRTANGGSSVQFLVDCRGDRPRIRPLTGREYARLQGAADFPINVGRRQAQNGFGDAVCVPAVSWLVDHAFGPLFQDLSQHEPVRTRFANGRGEPIAAGR
ncbi:MAG: DNA cytosine methyltransferase [Chloroflexi bacterium]|nr:DNA cytosine methyltransferase [Chloroflexota bacterium]MYC00709.1 DNA cytosine methyltransferase [Chloroflexota bacterium]